MSFPAFFSAGPVVETVDPLAQLLGASDDGRIDYCYADAVRLAGHSCPTVAGAFLMARAALKALFPDTPAERGLIEVWMPAPRDHGTTGVVAQVLTLLTGAAAENGFQGLGGRYARNGLLVFAGQASPGGVIFRRHDSGDAVAVELDASLVPGNPNQRALLGAIIQDEASDAQKREFANGWQERVRRMLLEFADDPHVIKTTHLAA
ncbi:MAG: hypothetical protein BGP25_15505 [Lysobacterales bacterium 63-13]|nr:MAG: hypothetical protein BGP25_15505 [Xanthomonadales bacterium 63-13]